MLMCQKIYFTYLLFFTAECSGNIFFGFKLVFRPFLFVSSLVFLKKKKKKLGEIIYFLLNISQACKFFNIPMLLLTLFFTYSHKYSFSASSKKIVIK